MIEAVVMGDEEPDMEVPRMTSLRSPESQAKLDSALAEWPYVESGWPFPLSWYGQENVASPGPVFAEERTYDTIHLKPTRPCGSSPKYLELAPGVHAKYCALAGLPLDDGRKRWHCEVCKVTFRTAVGEVTPIDRCIQCGGLTREMVPR